MHHDFLMLDITLSLVIFVVSSVANGCSVRLRPPLWWQAWQGVHHTFLLTYKTIPNRGIHETSKIFLIKWKKQYLSTELASEIEAMFLTHQPPQSLYSFKVMFPLGGNQLPKNVLSPFEHEVRF